MQDTPKDAEYPKVIDELKYSVRGYLFQDLSKETVTIRHGVDDVAVPYRQNGSFLLGTGVGGAAIIVLPIFYALGSAVYQVYYLSFEKRGQEALRGLAFFFGLLFVTEVLLILVFGVDYRYVQADYIQTTLRFSFFDLPLRMWVGQFSVRF